MRESDPVGVFDSGVGGISVLREMVSRLPNENYIYFGDTRNAPYGTKTPEEVREKVWAVVRQLLDENIKALVIACNTATSAAAAVLRSSLDIPVIGMEPALKPAQQLRRGGAILVLATPLTLREEKFERLMEKYGQGAVKVACPGLMELVEAGEKEEAGRYLRELFGGYDMDRVDAVVLGCTHYVFLRDMIKEMIPERTAITDGNEGTARQLGRVMRERGCLRTEGEGSVTLRTSGTEKDLRMMERLLRDGFT